MDKRQDRKSHRVTGSKNDRLGIAIGVHDKDGNELHSGDKVMFNGEECIVLYDRHSKRWKMAISRSRWYGDNEYDISSYGKAYSIPMDDGARMEMEMI